MIFLISNVTVCSRSLYIYVMAVCSLYYYQDVKRNKKFDAMTDENLKRKEKKNLIVRFVIFNHFNLYDMTEICFSISLIFLYRLVYLVLASRTTTATTTSVKVDNFYWNFYFFADIIRIFLSRFSYTLSGGIIEIFESPINVVCISISGIDVVGETSKCF